MSADLSHLAETINGLHVNCPERSPSILSDDELKGSRTHRQRSTRGRSQPFFIGVAGM